MSSTPVPTNTALITNTIQIFPPAFSFVPNEITIPIPSYLHFAFPPFPHALSHSVAQSSGQRTPCTPYSNHTADSTVQGFWSGIVKESWYRDPTGRRDDTAHMPIWEIYLTTSDLVYYYDAGGAGSVGYECLKYGVVGVVNPIGGVNGGEIERLRSAAISGGGAATTAAVVPTGMPRGGRWVSTRVGTVTVEDASTIPSALAMPTSANLGSPASTTPTVASTSRPPSNRGAISSAAIGGIAFASLSALGVFLLAWFIIKKQRNARRMAVPASSSSLSFQDEAPASGPEKRSDFDGFGSQLQVKKGDWSVE